MKTVMKFFIRGIDTLVPLGITLYAIYWLAIFTESLLGGLIRPPVPDYYYWPGMGLVFGLAAGLMLVSVVGVLVSVGPGRWLFEGVERVLGYVPLVKTILRATHDFTRFFFAPHEREDFGQVVWVPFGDVQVIGFVTRGPANTALDAPAGEHAVAVYVPFSYTIGGYTVYVQRSRLRPAGLSVEEAMRMVLTAGVSMTEPPSK